MHSCLSQIKDSESINANLFFGNIIGVMAVVVCHPLQVINTRMISTFTGDPPNIFYATHNIVMEDGLMGLYKGFGISIFSVFATRAASILVYWLLRPLIIRPDYYLPIQFIGFQAAQIALDFILYPIDTIRLYKILMANKSAWDVIQFIRSTGGMRAFWAGFRVHMYATVISNLIDTSYCFWQYCVLDKTMFNRPRKAEVSMYLRSQT